MRVRTWQHPEGRSTWRAWPGRAGALAALAGACGTGGPDTGPAFSVEDSAGVQVVRNGTTGALPAALLDSPQITVRIGAVEGAPELQFFAIRSIAEDDDGNIFVLDGGHAEVRVFDARGTHLRTFGRRGAGPGELQGPGLLHVHGDTVLIADGRLNRVTIFSRRGDVLGTHPMGSIETGMIYPLAGTPRGWIAQPFRSPGWPYRHMVEHRDTTRLILITSIEAVLRAAAAAAAPSRVESAPGSAWTELLRYPGPRRYGVNTSHAMTATDPLFEPDPVHAIDGMGRIHFTTAADYVIDTYDTEGRHVRRLTRAYTAVPVTDALIDRYAARVRAHWDTAAMVGEAALGKGNDEAKLALPHVASLPPIGRLLASRNGALWVERIDLASDPTEREWTRQPAPPRETRWDLFDPDGRLLGMVTLPPTFAPRLAGDRWMLGVLRDDLDVQYVVRLELRG